jgi:inner membrane protein
MASAISHAIAGLGIGACFYRPQMPKRVWVAGVLCSMFPDIDVVGFRYGVAYADFWGHRGFTHSLLFAALLAGLVTIALGASAAHLGRLWLFAYLFVATASHGVLDAMTDGGLGVAFFSPFNDRRYFLPWRPIRVSPIGMTRFFTPRGVAVLQNEFVWIWIPAIVVGFAIFIVRRQFCGVTSAEP